MCREIPHRQKWSGALVSVRSFVFAQHHGNAKSCLDIKTSPGDDSAELRRLAVAAKYRGRGIGRQLVKVVMAHARATGVESVYLRTSSSNVGALIAYRKYGFEIEKEYDMFKKLETHILRLEVAKCLI